MGKDFDSWNSQKKKADDKDGRVLFKEREIWWCKLGVNIGYEQDGKGHDFTRPVLILKKLNKKMFIGLPLSTVIKDDNDYYHSFTFNGRKQSVIIAQIKLMDSKRLQNRMGAIYIAELDIIKGKVKNLIF